MKWHRAVALDLLLVRQILMNSNNLYWKRFNDCWLRGVYQWQNLVFSCSFFMIWSIRQLSLLRCSRSNWICSDENYNLSDNCWGNIKIKQIMMNESCILHLVCTFLSTVSCVRIYRWWKTSHWNGIVVCTRTLPVHNRCLLLIFDYPNIYEASEKKGRRLSFNTHNEKNLHTGPVKQFFFYSLFSAHYYYYYFYWMLFASIFFHFGVFRICFDLVALSLANTKDILRISSQNFYTLWWNHSIRSEWKNKKNREIQRMRIQSHRVWCSFDKN